MTAEPLTVCGIPLVDDDGEPVTHVYGSPMAAVVVLEAIADDGSPFLWVGHTEGVTAWAGLGMFRSAVLSSEDHLRDSWEDE